MIVREMTEDERRKREEIIRGAEALKEAGICPTCRDLETGDVYPPREARTFYADDLVLCLLEAYPRSPGHSIVLVRPDYEDISQLPASIGGKVFSVIRAAAGAIKGVLPAEKAYLCSMCDGRRNHLHFQLIPRLSTDTLRGSGVFVKERGILADPGSLVDQLRVQMEQRKDFQGEPPNGGCAGQ